MYDCVLFVSAAFCHAVFRLTKSSMLLSAPVLASTQQVSLVVIENVTDIFFPKWVLRCEICTIGGPKFALIIHINMHNAALSETVQTMATDTEIRHTSHVNKTLHSTKIKQWVRM